MTALLVDRRIASGVAALAAALAVIGVLVALFGSADRIADGDAMLRVDGAARVVRAAGGEDLVDDDTTLHAGDEVVMVEGTAVAELSGARRVELRTDDTASHIRMEDPIVLVAGDVLAEGPVSVTVDGVTSRLRSGAARVRSASAVVAVYQGSAAVVGPGGSADVPALRQAAAADLGGGDPVDALRYDASDGWDRRFLGQAIALGERLVALSGAYTASLGPGEGTTVGFYRLVLPALDTERRFTEDLLDSARRPGETLVGASITVLGTNGEFAARWGDVFAFRDDGAEWGLVALDQGVNGTPLLATIERALDGSALEFAAVTTGDVSGPFAEVVLAPPGVDRHQAAPPPAEAPRPAPGGPGDPDPAPQPDEPGGPPVDLPDPPVPDPLDDVVDDVLGGLLGENGPLGGIVDGEGPLGGLLGGR